MTTAIDTNVVVALWNDDDTLNSRARRGLETALARGGLVIAPPVFAELLASPGRNEAFLDSFCAQTGISVDWDLNETIWRAAGRAFQTCSGRHQKEGQSGTRRILADFVIGAHAAHNGFALLTLDDRLFRAAFPRLSLITV